MEADKPSRPPYGRLVAWGLVVGVVYFLAGKFGLTLAYTNASASAVWPPTGIALATFLLLGFRLWPAIFAGAFLVNLTTQGTVATSILIAAGNTLEGVVGAALVLKFANGSRAFERAQDVFKFAGLAAVAATMVSATVGVTTLATLGFASWADFASIWLTWWLGDASGALIVAPLVLLWARRSALAWPAKRLSEAVALLLILFAVGVALFTPLSPLRDVNHPIAFFCLPPIIWTAVRFTARETVTASVLISSIALWGTLRGHGPFAVASPNTSLILLQSFMAVLTLTALAMAATVSERRTVEAALRQSQETLEGRVQRRTVLLQEREAQLNEAQSIAHVGSWLWDIKADKIEWSDELFRIYGLRPQEFGATYENFLATIHPDDRARVHGIVEAALRDHAPFEFEHRTVRPDGVQRLIHARGEVVCDAAGNPVRMIGTGQDLTERKKMDEKFRALVEGAPDAVLIADAEGRIVLANAQVERSFGFSRGELIGQPVELLIPKPFRERHVDHRRAYMDAPRVRPMGLGLDLYGRRKDGTEFPVEISLSPLETEGGSMVAASVRDVTERRRLERDREEASIRLRELETVKQQNEFKTQFMNTAAHELGTPLTPIMLQLHLLKTKLNGGGAATAQSLQILERNIQRLNLLVQDLLEGARLEAHRLVLHRKRVDVSELVKEAVQSFQEAARKENVTLDAQTPPDVFADADEGRIVQVVYNLISNAIKFTPAGGRVTVEALQQGNEILVRVRDTGLGLSPQQIGQLFQAFVQVHDPMQSSQPGTGLGLYISKGIVELHGGRIWCESEGAGRGSTFSFTLPRPIEGESSSPASSAKTADPRAAPRRIQTPEAPRPRE